jgi:hypothetical protein
MSLVQERMDAVADLVAEVKDHPMCAHFIDEGANYVVYYPDGMYPNGARASTGMGKALALSRLLQVMERHWKENGIN